MDWDEFTSFCVMIGMISTNQQKVSETNDLVHEAYVQDNLECKRSFERMSVKHAKFFAELNRFAFVINVSDVITVR